MSRGSIILIYARDQNGGIGKDGGLLFDFKEDMKHFKKITIGHMVLMGKNTYLSLHKKALPGRENLVWNTRDESIIGESQEFREVGEAGVELELTHGKDIYVIGGSYLYNLFWDKADKIIETVVDEKFDGADTFVPRMIPPNFIQKEKELIIFDKDRISGKEYQLRVNIFEKETK